MPATNRLGVEEWPTFFVRCMETTTWQFDISPSDLKEIDQAAWIDPERKERPMPMLFSVADYWRGAAYQEYRCV